MVIEPLLHGIRHLGDLPRVLSALGVCPAWEEIPADYWSRRPLDRPLCHRSALIGRLGELPWYGVEAEDLVRSLRQIARILVRRGEAAAVIGVDPVSGALALTVAFDRLPCLMLVPQSDRKTVAACLRRITEITPSGRLATAGRLAEILSLEGLGRRFFTGFEAALECISEAVGRRRPEENRSVALLQLNRVLFLYFVQSKGWLDGKPDFLRAQVERCLQGRKQLDRHLLRPLFFGTLNLPTEERTSAVKTFGRIPFLNGGLFEPHPLERSWKGTIPNRVWRETFDNLFERFQFTAGEGSATSIAPDMLGRVFEGVMARGERRQSGTFYTPPTMVRTLLDESLGVLLSEELGVPFPEAIRLMRGRDPVVRLPLETMTLLDPAVGSGAFLLAALERLSELLASSSQENSSIRRRILQRNLFGVDINPTAVRLTELRLWLAVIAEDRAESPEQVHPLPNLDCLVRQGDSLTDPLGLIARMPFRAGAMGESLATLRLAFSGATGSSKREAARALRKAEHLAMKACLDQAEEHLHYSIAECLSSARGADLFGNQRGDQRTVARIRTLRRKLTPIRQARRRLEQDGEIGWFQYESHFADVFSKRGGFDLIVGNPPWVRAEKLPRAVREQLGQRYHWWRAGDQAGGYRHQPDLSVAFLERAHELARTGGVVGLLLPAKITSATYGTAARQALARDLTLHTVSDLGSSYPAAFEATVYPLALISSKRRPAADQRVRVRLDDPGSAMIPQRELGSGPWMVRHPEAGMVARVVSERFPAIGAAYAIQLGVKTGANHCFLDPPGRVEPELVRRAFRGRDLGAFRITGAVPMLWPYSDELCLRTELPPGARAQLQPHIARLIARADYDGGPPWALFRLAAAAARPRVVWADLSRHLAAAYLAHDDRRIPLNTCYVLPCQKASEALALTGWLNSSWVRGLAKLRADPASGGFARFKASTVGFLPLPATVLHDQTIIDWVKDALVHDFSQAELDELTAGHLDLPRSSLRVLAAVG